MHQHKQFNHKSLAFILTTLIVLVMSFSYFTSSASASPLKTGDVESDEIVISDINYIDGVDLSQEEIQEELKKHTENTTSDLNSDYFSTLADTPTALSASIIRISSDIHQLYLNYAGTASINSFRIRNLTISNTNILFPEQYYSNSYLLKDTNGQASGSQYLATFNAPISTTKFRVKMGTLEGYYHAYGWRVGIISNGVVTVK